MTSPYSFSPDDRKAFDAYAQASRSMQTTGGIVPDVWSGYDAAGVNCGSRDINFTPVAQASSSQTINQVTVAYRDTGNTARTSAVA